MLEGHQLRTRRQSPQEPQRQDLKLFFLLFDLISDEVLVNFQMNSFWCSLSLELLFF